MNELLDVSRIRAGRLQLDLEPADLVDVVRDVGERFRDASGVARAGCEVRMELPDCVIGRWDRTRLEQIVENLLSNAVKYGAGKPVTVKLACSASSAVLTVVDHGIGISSEDRARIFERFERAVSARHFGGMGVGLYVVRQVVQALGGTVDVESEPAGGSQFIVTLPLAGPAESFAPVAHADAAGQGMREETRH